MDFVDTYIIVTYLSEVLQTNTPIPLNDRKLKVMEVTVQPVFSKHLRDNQNLLA